METHTFLRLEGKSYFQIFKKIDSDKKHKVLVKLSVAKQANKYFVLFRMFCIYAPIPLLGKHYIHGVNIFSRHVISIKGEDYTNKFQLLHYILNIPNV